jgi:ArsR family transcriptional regulator, arsenate/arsenite/antimonite-responsive transcriptional repressor
MNAPRWKPTARPEEEEELARLCKALGHPARVRILRFLMANRGCWFGELANELPVARSTVAQHLAILREAGLLKADEQAGRGYYCLDPDRMRRLTALFGDFSAPCC